MSIFGSILSKLVGHSKATEAPATDDSPKPSAGGTASAAPDVAPEAINNVDVAGILDGLAAKSSQKLDWHNSIVDTMKLLGLDSSLDSRKSLAKELGYGGDTGDSASMNIWLHKQVMQKLAANGGKVPDSLRA